MEQAEQDGPASLVVAPKGVYEEWCKQMVKHGVELRCQSLQGVQDTPTVQSAAATNDLVFTTYKSVQLSTDSFSAVSWRGITLDEGHEIRNSRSQTTAALLSLRAEYRFALTGTPWNNSTGDLWPLYEFVAPGLLGPAETFHRETCVELDENGSQWHCDRLRARISLFTIRRTRRGLGLIKDETSVQRILCVPSAAQWDLYEAERLRGVVELKEVFHRRGFKHSGVKVQNVLMRLRQVLSDPRLLGTAAAARVPSIKAEICRQLLTKHENAGDHTVICSPFSSVLDLIASDRRTDGLQVASITGSTSQDQRNAAREELDSGELPALMLSMKAGGVALNLQSANVYIQYDGWFNPSAEDQARMRVDRFGNSRPVTVYELVVPNSVEQRMDAIKARKRQIAEAIFGDAPAVATEPKEQDVWDLLEPMSVPQKLKLAA